MDATRDARLMSSEHDKFKMDLMRLVKKHGGLLTGPEIVALVANTLGLLMAFEYGNVANDEAMWESMSINTQLGLMEGLSQISKESQHGR